MQSHHVGLGSGQVQQITADHPQQIKDIEDKRMEDHTKKSILFHLGRAVGNIQGKQKLKSDEKDKHERMLNSQIDAILESTDSREQKLRNTQRFYNSNRKQMSSVQRFQLQKAIAELSKVAPKPAEPMPVTFASNLPEVRNEPMYEPEPEQKKDKTPNDIQEKIVTETIKKQVGKN